MGPEFRETDHPRDDDGKFTEGGGGGGAPASATKASTTTPSATGDWKTTQALFRRMAKERREQKKANAGKVGDRKRRPEAKNLDPRSEKFAGMLKERAARLGFKGQLRIVEDVDFFTTTAGGHAAAMYYPDDGSIEFHAGTLRKAINFTRLSQLLRHEVTHSQFHPAFEDKASGVADFIEKNKFALEKQDGTTEYAKAYWKNKAPLKNCVDESLAEMLGQEERPRPGGVYEDLYKLVRAYGEKKK